MPLPFGYHETIATPKASRSTEAVWSFRADRAGSSLVLPDGRCDLILRSSRDAPERLIPVVTGPATTAYAAEFREGDRWYGIRLRPNRARSIWGAEITRAKDTVLVGAAAGALIPSLLGDHSDSTALDRLVNAIPKADAPAGGQRLARALDVIHATGGRIRIERLAVVLGCSPRHLNRLFRAYVGLTPKVYLQLAQFHRALRMISTGGLSITEAAFEGGYADHAHLTRSFRRFGGFTPRRLPRDLSLPLVFSGADVGQSASGLG